VNPLVIKSDIINFAQLSENINSRAIDFHVANAQVYEIEPRLGKLLFDAFIALPLEGSTPELQPELRLFYNDYLKRYACLVAYCRFLAEHGTNITQFGFTQLGDPAGTFQNADESRRAVFLRQYRSDADVALTRLFNRLKELNYTLDGIRYDQNKTETKKVLPISAIRKKNISDSPFKDEFYERI
jgi:hypothetical protein